MNSPELPPIPQNKIDTDYEKYDKAREAASAKYRKMIEEVDEYLKGLVTSELSFEDILEQKFKDYEDILDSPLMDVMEESEKTDILKETVYNLEIRPKKKNSQAEEKIIH